tara:strand:- start:3823 stop:4257 length:435 start_codon:yes stop_codon:yes gene_type:complete
MDYYTNSGQPWYDQEEEQLKKEYNEQKLDINEIGKIHKRTPGGIGSRLCILGIIEHRLSARGYTEYKNSNLYREICEKGPPKKEKRPKEPKEKKIKTSVTESNILITIKQSNYNELKEELHDVKNQLNEIKDMIRKLAIYDFDD